MGQGEAMGSGGGAGKRGGTGGLGQDVKIRRNLGIKYPGHFHSFIVILPSEIMQTR